MSNLPNDADLSEESCPVLSLTDAFHDVGADLSEGDDDGLPNLTVERALAAQGGDVIVGFDEVGRGALAGPVMVGAAALWSSQLDDLTVPEGVADSKLLSQRRRESIFDSLCIWPSAQFVGQASNVEIDQWGMSYSLGVAALRALRGLETKLQLNGMDFSGSRVEVPTICGILDGSYDYISKAMNTFDAPQVPVSIDVKTQIKADRLCALVSVASIIAKVTRDRLMVSVSRGNPEYGRYQWSHNKGYGTKEHRDAIRKYGPTPLHRLTWHLI